MNLHEYLRRQFAYDAWANREVLGKIRSLDREDARSLQLMLHICAAERLWMDRLKQLPQSVAVWPKFDLAWCESEVAKLESDWPKYLDDTSELSEAISYKNSKGENFSNAIVDVLTHVTMHSAYHRGQIASHMREMGETPAYTDFIHGIRQGLVK
ncbi:MAG TPA: DinB family protein [Candidatus Sulfotelmatobacter sp.]|nr:DinB family protein [Candidatus Sulfotelmatobacter sp.]